MAQNSITKRIDARTLGTMIDCVHRELLDADIAKIAGTYHAWRSNIPRRPEIRRPGESRDPVQQTGEAAPYQDIPGFCKSATLDDIGKHGHVLTPAHFVGGEANLDFVRLLVTEAQSGRVFGLDEMLILNALWQERRLTTEDGAHLIQKPDAEARTALHRLVEAGLIEERGQKKGRTWHLSAAAYRALGDKAGYVRQRGFEPLQQEQMVIQYVEKHGRITRGEASELCRISGPQAYRLLDRLAEQGLLVRDGKRGRGVGYRKGRK
jgi:predicted transcriptional regulator